MQKLRGSHGRLEEGHCGITVSLATWRGGRAQPTAKEPRLPCQGGAAQGASPHLNDPAIMPWAKSQPFLWGEGSEPLSGPVSIFELYTKSVSSVLKDSELRSMKKPAGGPGMDALGKAGKARSGLDSGVTLRSH